MVRNTEGLLKGGKPGHRGGTGAIKSSVRQKMREGAESALPYLCQIAKGDTDEAGKPARSESIKATEILLRFGYGDIQNVVLESEEQAKAMLKAVQRVVGSEHLAAIIKTFEDELGIYLDGESE